jgi:predicted enzyme related to lactoylglutathione lyase
MPRVIHFEIHVSDIKRAIKFYNKVFAWDFKQLDGLEYCLILTGPDNQRGINGGLMKRIVPVPEKSAPIIGYVCTVDVPSVEDYCKRVLDAGGTIEMDKMLIPGVGWLAYCKDTENNIFGIIEMNINAD